MRATSRTSRCRSRSMPSCAAGLLRYLARELERLRRDQRRTEHRAREIEVVALHRIRIGSIVDRLRDVTLHDDPPAGILRFFVLGELLAARLRCSALLRRIDLLV